MPAITFRCPHCSADLKVRDDQITAAPVNCPDCRRPIVITRDEFGHVTANASVPQDGHAKAAKGSKSSAPSKPAGVPATKSAPAPIVREESVHATESPASTGGMSRNSILILTGSVAGLVAILVAGLAAAAGLAAWPWLERSGRRAVVVAALLVTEVAMLESVSAAFQQCRLVISSYAGHDHLVCAGCCLGT